MDKIYIITDPIMHNFWPMLAFVATLQIWKATHVVFVVLLRLIVYTPPEAYRLRSASIVP